MAKIIWNNAENGLGPQRPHRVSALYEVGLGQVRFSGLIFTHIFGVIWIFIFRIFRTLSHIFILPILAASAAGSCPPPYQSFGGGCLQYFPSAGLLNFSDAQNFCKMNAGSSIQTFAIANSQDPGTINSLFIREKNSNYFNFCI